jgi:hypothetical protein
MNNVWCDVRECGHNETGRCALLSIKLTWDDDVGLVCEQYANYEDDIEDKELGISRFL